jgi:hypothetical protein
MKQTLLLRAGYYKYKQKTGGGKPSPVFLQGIDEVKN